MHFVQVENDMSNNAERCVSGVLASIKAVYLLKADAKRYGQGHYTLDQINGVEEIDEDCDKIRSYVKGITIGSEKRVQPYQ